MGGFYVIWRSFTTNGRRLGYRSYYCYTRKEAEAKAEELRNQS